MIPFKELAPLAPKSFEKQKKYIELEYRPIFVEKEGSVKKLEKVICISSDKTKEREFKKMADKERSHVNMVLKILSDRSGFKSMIREVKRNISEIKLDIIEKNERVDLKNIFRIMHTSKGAFSSYSMVDLTTLAHKFEDQILKMEQAEINIDENSNLFNNLRTKISFLDEKLENFLEENKVLLGDDENSDEERVQKNY